MNSYYPVDVKPLKNYQLQITFDNNEVRLFDVKPYLNDEYFAPLRNISIFESVKIHPISLGWVGDIDMCPDELYYNSVPCKK
ncbi:MAG: DUF2442 domain-containing protein [Lachnoclostridium sp.]|nr:DUF2442 domain-containing protein [Lachnoclostridium sp.]